MRRQRRGSACHVGASLVLLVGFGGERWMGESGTRGKEVSRVDWEEPSRLHNSGLDCIGPGIG
jgi:hypothetical protein